MGEYNREKIIAQSEHNIRNTEKYYKKTIEAYREIKHSD